MKYKIMKYNKLKRRKASAKTDSRINIINEILNGIKIIKMYCWEDSFKKIVSKIRK